LAVQAGVDFDTLAASFATLRDNGTPASVAATALKNSLISLAAPTEAAQAQMQSLGISFENFTDQSGNLDFQALLQGLATSLADISDRDVRIQKLADIFGREAAPAVATLVANVGRLDENLVSVANSAGSVDAGLETINQSFGRQVELLQGMISGLATEFGSVVAAGLAPLLSTASALVNGFLALPAPIKDAVLGITAFVGALSGAIALMAAFSALQANTTVTTTLNTAQILVNTTARQAAMAIETAYATLKAINTANLTKENVQLALNTVATKAAAAAKAIYSGATTAAAIATQALSVKLLSVVATVGLAVAAFKVASAVFAQFTAGADFGREFSKSIDELERGRRVVEDTATDFEDAGDRIGRLFDVLKERGPIEALQTVFVDLQSALIGVGDSTSRYGESVTFLGRELGYVTQTQLANQRQQIALAEGVDRLSSSVDGTIDLFAQYGQAIAGAEKELSPDELRAFTAAAAEQSGVLQEEIEVLRSQMGVNAEMDAQLQNEITVRENLIRQLEEKVAAQNGDAAAVRDGANAARELSEVMEELTQKYGDLDAELKNDQATDLARIAEQQAAGLISEQEAQLQRAEVNREAIETRLRNNQALLAELQGQRAARGGNDEEAAELDREILAVQTQIAGDRQELAQDQIDAAEAVAEAEREALEERFREAERAIQETATLRERDALELERSLLASGASQEAIAEATAQARLEAERASIEAQIQLQQDKVASYEEGSEEQAEAALELASLQNDLISNQIEQERHLRDVQVRAIEERQEREAIANDAVLAGMQERLAASERVARSLQRQSDLLASQQNLIQAAGDLEMALRDREIAKQEEILGNENATAAQRQQAAADLIDLTIERGNAAARALMVEQKNAAAAVGARD
jgi:phage tail tape measure protein, TP901 family, core region